jgi:hypothetical protein
MTCRLVDIYRHFGEKYCLYLFGRRMRKAWKSGMFIRGWIAVITAMSGSVGVRRRVKGSVSFQDSDYNSV